MNRHMFVGPALIDGELSAPYVRAARRPTGAPRSAHHCTGIGEGCLRPVSGVPSPSKQLGSAPLCCGAILCSSHPRKRQDPLNGYPPKYARDDIPTIKSYADGTTTPSPKSVDFKPGELLGCVSGELGLRKFLEDAGHTLVVTADKDGEGSQLEKELADADYVISQV